MEKRERVFGNEGSNSQNNAEAINSMGVCAKSSTTIQETAA